MGIRVNLPEQKPKDDSDKVRMLYEAATLGSTHSDGTRTAGIGTGSPSFALPKRWDPSRRGMQTNYGAYGTDDLLSFDTNKQQRDRILMACRNIMDTHPVVSSCIEVIARYVVQGIRLIHKDPDLQRFYTELFLEDLDFQNFLIQVGESYWCDGMAYVYGEWSDDLKVWTAEDILDPTGVQIVHTPFGIEDTFELVPNRELMRNITSGGANSEKFRQMYPEMYNLIAAGHNVPLSNDRMTFIALKNRPSKTYGTPPMLKAWNTLRLEDRLQNAMEATADRLYAPLIMFTVGGKLPNGDNFIPSANALDAFRDNLDLALSSNFRAIVTHDGVSSQEIVRSGNNMSAYKQDLDMYDERIFEAFGLSDAIMKPQSGAYATSALEFQLTSQILSTYQKTLIGIYNRQAAMVAEGQKHYLKDDQGEVIYDRRLQWNSETGEDEVIKTPKLDFPEMQFDTINFKDEQQERQFMMTLKNAGVPISDSDLAVGVDVDLESSREKYNDEQIQKSVDEARVQESIFNATLKQGLPVPVSTAQYYNNTIPNSDAVDVLNKFRDSIPTTSTPNDKDSPDQIDQPDQNATRPDVSDEQRADMPKS